MFRYSGALLLQFIASICLLAVADARPASPHPLHRRAVCSTAAGDLGDLTATNTGILNENHVPLANCKEILDSGFSVSGLYKIDPGDGFGEFTVFCDMTLSGGGWTVMQRRIDDSKSFERTWKEYKTGFGDFNGNFWLGLQKIKRITDMGTYELYVGLENHYSTDPDCSAWARYGSFGLGTETQNYKLSVAQYDSTSTAGDALLQHDGESFSTLDRDNDSHSTTHCSQRHKGGWWYFNCQDSNLNGVWYEDGELPVPTIPDGIIWESFSGSFHSLKTTVMALRPA